MDKRLDIFYEIYRFSIADAKFKGEIEIEEYTMKPHSVLFGILKVCCFISVLYLSFTMSILDGDTSGLKK